MNRLRPSVTSVSRVNFTPDSQEAHTGGQLLHTSHDKTKLMLRMSRLQYLNPHLTDLLFLSVGISIFTTLFRLIVWFSSFSSFNFPISLRHAYPICFVFRPIDPLIPLQRCDQDRAGIPCRLYCSAIPISILQLSQQVLENLPSGTSSKRCDY